jgi:TIR domain-containing protein
VRDTLAEAGYEVFWDQETPVGKDWDSWIRERLAGAKLVVTLWTRSSVASPNVRHEAIIAREAGKLLPVMVDELAPTDFPMGLFLVQALMIGRTAGSFRANGGRLLQEVEARIGPPGKSGVAMPRPATRQRRRLVLVAMTAVLIVLFAVLVWPSINRLIDPQAPPVSADEVRAAIALEAPARERIARSAENALTRERATIGTSWAWFSGQLISAAPMESRRFAGRYFEDLRSAERPDCGCYYIESIPNSIGNAWVILAAARTGRPAPARLLETILTSQHRDGWWTISFNGAQVQSNAATHASAMLTIALAEAQRAGIVPAPFRQRVGIALRRAAMWLNRGPEEGSDWSDYPYDQPGGDDSRRAQNLVFAAMATVASHLSGETQNHLAASAFIRSATDLPDPAEHFPSGVYVVLGDGIRYIDNYRHPVSPWIGAAAVIAYRHGSMGDRRRLRRIIRQWLEVDLNDERLVRQDWITAETLFLRSLVFPYLNSRS